MKGFVEKFPGELELVDRARFYVKIAEERSKETKEVVSLKSADDYYHYGVYKMNTGDFEEAQKLLDKAAKLKPDDGKVYYAMADLNSLAGQTDASLECLKKAIQLDKFFRVLAQNETDFQPLWEDKKFKLITRIV